MLFWHTVQLNSVFKGQFSFVFQSRGLVLGVYNDEDGNLELTQAAEAFEKQTNKLSQRIQV